MILELDYGNTRLKWRLLDVTSMHCTASGSVVTLQEFAEELRALGCTSLSFARCCSVRSKSESKQLTALIQKMYGVTVVYAQSGSTLSGVSNGYLEPDKLGVDRWLAMVGAYAQINGACVVIDCGTAITVDYIDADGVHLGGCIAPGLKLMDKVLRGATHMPVGAQGIIFDDECFLGRSTQQGIASGIKGMVTGFIREKLTLAHSILGDNFVVIASGGDSALVSAVTADAIIQEDLVFTGLAIACPQLA